MSTATEFIDGTLGDGWSEEWQEIEQDLAHERKRTSANFARYSRFKEPGRTDRLWWDMNLLELVAADYRRAIDRISAGEYVDPAQARRVRHVLVLALATVEHDNDALDAAVAAGVFAGFVAIPFAILQWQARVLSEALEVLKARLERAQSEWAGAALQTAINGAITAITYSQPHVALIAKIGIVSAQWILDDALGPKKSKLLKGGSKATKGTKLVAAIGHFDDLGKKATAAGHFFDLAELNTAGKNVDEIRRLIDKANKAYKELSAELRKNKPALLRFIKEYERWMEKIRDIEDDATESRYSMEQLAAYSGYKLPP
jgi:hypothetical protein